MRFYSDPSHGWLEVSMADLVKLGIAHKITSYSYQHADKVYLEEDQDLTTYLDALEDKTNLTWSVLRDSLEMFISDQPSVIRHYASYQPEAVL